MSAAGALSASGGVRFRTAGLHLYFPFALACIVALLAGCAPLEPQRPPPEPRVEYREVKTDRAVPCFTEAERPIPPTPTPINLDTATTDQMAAALAADDAADALFVKAVEAIFIKCQKAAGKEIK